MAEFHELVKTIYEVMDEYCHFDIVEYGETKAYIQIEDMVDRDRDFLRMWLSNQYEESEDERIKDALSMLDEYAEREEAIHSVFDYIDKYAERNTDILYWYFAKGEEVLKSFLDDIAVYENADIFRWIEQIYDEEPEYFYYAFNDEVDDYEIYGCTEDERLEMAKKCRDLFKRYAEFEV